MPGTSLEMHLVFLLEKLESASEPLCALVESQSLEVDFFCYWLSETGHGGPCISAATLKRIAALGARLDFDFYSSSQVSPRLTDTLKRGESP